MPCFVASLFHQNRMVRRLGSLSPSPYSLYLVKCPAYSRHSIIIWGRNAYIILVKIRGKVQSCTSDRKITHYQLCLPTLMKRGFTHRFGNFLQTQAGRFQICWVKIFFGGWGGEIPENFQNQNLNFPHAEHDAEFMWMKWWVGMSYWSLDVKYKCGGIGSRTPPSHGYRNALMLKPLT